MTGKRKDKRKIKESKTIDPKVLNRIFIAVIIIFTFALYGNTVRNYYSLDDYHIARENPNFKNGIKAIPEIFTSMYSTQSGLSFGYRPLVRSSFAIEYDIFGSNPYVSHFFNILFYLIGVLLLYKVLRRLFRNLHLFFPFIVSLLFLAHPIHTEVVASLKNRDELFVLIFALWALDLFLKYADTEKLKYAGWGLLLIIPGFLSKPTVAAFFLVIPLSLYFFTDLKPKKLIYLTLAIVGIGIIAAFVPFLYLPTLDRPMRMEENPISFDDSFTHRIAYGAYTLYFYLKLLVVPHPLLYFYGYNMVPVVGLGNIKVILSILFHLGIFIYALYSFKKKRILSYAILFYLVTIAMYTNVVKPAPGIIGERFLLIPSIGFCIALAFGLYKLFLETPYKIKIPAKKTIFILLIMIVILAPYSAKTIIRNTQWRTQYTLDNADMPWLYNSVRANDLYANEIMKSVKWELAKPVNVLKFMEPSIQEAIHHWKRSVELLPSYYAAWNSLGVIQSRIYKNYDTALYYFNKSLEYKPDRPQTLFNVGQAYEGMQKYDTALIYYEKSLEFDPDAINTRSRMANIYYTLGSFRRAVEINYEIMKINPMESLPYINLGNYHIFQGDTVNAVRFYEEGVKLGAPAVASIFLSRYYAEKGDISKSDYYKNISRKRQKEKKYLVP